MVHLIRALLGRIVVGLWAASCLAQSVSNTQFESLKRTEEAKQVLAARQQQIQNLPDSERKKVVESLEKAAKTDSEFNQLLVEKKLRPVDILTVPPDRLSRPQITAANHTIFRVIDTTIPPIIISAAHAVTTGEQKEPDFTQQINKQLPDLAQKAASVGRLMYATKRSFDDHHPDWYELGTVFVTKAGILATACHTLDNLIPRGLQGDPVIDPDIVAAVEFGDSENLGKLLPVRKILGVGNLEGFDVAFLGFEGGEGIPNLTFAQNLTTARRLFVIGYPVLSGLQPGHCPDRNADPTGAYFCQLRTDHPDLAKIVSPADKMTSDSAHPVFGVITYNAPTRFGQSGSPVLDAETLQVIGIHYCCTGLPAADETLKCSTSHQRESDWNEAISAVSIAQNPFLKNYVTIAPSSQ